MKALEILLIIVSYDIARFAIRKIFGPQTFYMLAEGAVPVEMSSPNLFYKWKAVKRCRKEGWVSVSKASLETLFDMEDQR
jgi:hypothetical protein